ncbi:MAG: AMP-binding protein [Rhizobiaceae bacterium]|nr:AMP-binding protein [Rhizobiaceae bacterium]
MDYPKDSYCYQVAKDGWQLPETYNMGLAACDDWAVKTPNATALILADEDQTISYAKLRDLSNQMANLFCELGLNRGDRIGILLPQALETAVGHLGAFKCGLISVPLFMLFGPDALEHRVIDAGIKVIITNQKGADKLSEMKDEAREGLKILTIGGVHNGLKSLYFQAMLSAQSNEFKCVQTGPDDPAMIIYTSGTTGSPKGALHGHRMLAGHMTGFETFNDFKTAPGRVIWTPADWAWIGGLFDVLIPALACGMSVVSKRFEKFTADAAFDLLADYKVQHAFLPPTALKLMRSTYPDHSPRDLHLISVGSGGESLGAPLLDWGKTVLGVTINEFYGQTEGNLLISSCAALEQPRPGIIGKAVAGHEMAAVDMDGHAVPDGEIGVIAAKAPDAVMMLNYWNNSQATKDKFIGDWMLTGDMGIVESDGWIRFVGRDDDVITSAGYRIGPGSIEDCLMRHPSVKIAGVVGKPDETRTEIVVAFVVLADGVASSDDLLSELQTHVKTRLAAHEYPREIHVLDELPVTTTGKVMRRKLRDRLV